MRRVTKDRPFKPAVLLVFMIGLSCLPVRAVAETQPTIGSVTVVRNKVQVAHRGEKSPIAVKGRDPVLFLDRYETFSRARLKLLFEDDSLLTLGEKSSLEIAENVYNPKARQRKSVMKLLSGRARVLVGKIFSGTGSKFEIHTPTAVAASRGTYYIVWLFVKDGKIASGVVSLAKKVDVKNIDPAVSGAVTVGPNFYTVVVEGSPPTAPAPIDPKLLEELLDSTALDDSFAEPIPLLTDLINQGLTSIPSPGSLPGAKSRIFPARGREFFPEADEISEEPGVPPVPPIPQQPAGATSPATLEINFP